MRHRAAGHSVIVPPALGDPLLLLWTTFAAATEIDVHGFLPAAMEPDPRDLLSIRRAGRVAGQSAYAGVLVDYAKSPLVAEQLDGSRLNLVDHLATANLSAGFSPHKIVRFDLTVPFYWFSGDRLESGGTWSGAGLSDSRVSALVSLLAPSEQASVGFGLALVPHLDIPTGQFAPYLGRRGVAGGGVVSATLEADSVTFSVEGGLQIEPKVEDLGNLSNSDAVRVGAGAGILFTPQVGLNAEVYGQIPLDGQTGTTETPFEAATHVRYASAGGGLFVVGGAIGISQGAGAPAFRAFLGGGFGSTAKPRDRDHDGIVDKLDACKLAAETMNGLEDEDGCPDRLPTLSVTVALDGNPVAGAEVQLEGSETHAFQSKVLPRSFEVMPDTNWSGRARLGACLKGQGSVQVGRDDRQLDIVLERKRAGEVRVILMDLTGNIVEGAVVSFASEKPGCVPGSPLKTVGDGPLAVQVGQGVHEVTVRHGGFVQTQSVTVVPGNDAEIVMVATQ